MIKRLGRIIPVTSHMDVDKMAEICYGSPCTIHQDGKRKGGAMFTMLEAWVYNRPIAMDLGCKRSEPRVDPRRDKTMPKQTIRPAVQIGFAFAGIRIVVSFAGDSG